jgi:asparagine N-glycosylation enzyme membrane subunit Stt3
MCELEKLFDFNLKENPMTISTVLLVVLVLFLVGSLPTWPHSKSWGYGPSGVSGVLVLILVVLLLTGRL